MAGNTTTTTLSSGYRNYFSRQLLKYAVQETILDQFGIAATIPKNQGSKAISMFRYGAPSIADIQTLTEGTSPADSTASQLSLTAISKALAQYGESIILTDILKATDLLMASENAVKRLGLDIALWNDSVTRNVLQGSNLTASNGSIGSGVENGGSGLDNSDTLTEVYGQPATTTQTFAGLNSDTSTPTCNGDALLDMMTKLKKNRAQLVNGSYVFATDPRVARDLMRDSNWLNASNYGNKGEPYYKGEVGKIYGCKVVVQTNSFVALGSATVADRYVYATSGGGGTGTGKDIITSFLFGDQAYGFPQLGGDNPFSPRVILLDQPDKSDKLNQRIYISAKAFWTALRLNPNYYIVYRSKTGNTL